MSTLLPLTNSLPALGSSPVDTSAATTYTDINGLAALKKDPSSPQSISAVAEQVEALFLQMMLKSMRDATASDDPDGNEMGMYQDMFDKQVALTISQHQDLGIGALLKRQLTGTPKPASPQPVSTGAASTSSAPAIAQTPAGFVNQVMPTLQRAPAALGLNPLRPLAQAALETGWGQRMPRTADGSSSLNLFGIKAGDEWTGGRATPDTGGVSNRVGTPRPPPFPASCSLQGGATHFLKPLQNNPPR